MIAPPETQFNTFVDQTFALQSLADARLNEQFGSVVFKDAGADSILTVFTAADF
jgi:hypothetical protein